MVELGCGSGILTRQLLRDGHRVIGVDQSAAMLRIARKHAPGAKFVRASLLDFELPGCDAVFAVGEVFNYLFDRRNGPKALARLFKRIYAALRPGGVFAFDLATPGRGGGVGSRTRLIEGRDWIILLQTHERRRPATLTRRIICFRRIGRTYRRSDETHDLRLYPAVAIKRALRDAGFAVRVSRSYGTFRLPAPGWIVFHATKRRRVTVAS